ncbi:type I polyketide synthase [Chloroflexi bacterium TSY]|nr:type I polyketide synthase [Chloroflexi bacterium TSY]
MTNVSTDLTKTENIDTDEQVDGIAIVGMAGRFPSAQNLDEFWDNLRNGVNCIIPIPDDELELSKSDAAVAKDNPNYIKKAAAVEDADMFDAAFFGIYPKEAQAMDPQHRIFLECSWQALEDAGYNPDTYEGAIGVFAGSYMNTYILSSLDTHPDFMTSLANSFHGGSLQTELGNDKDYLATRVSFKLNLRGPGLTIQTACSTSLVAVAQACQNLMSYQCDMALAGTATLRFPQKRGYLYEEDGMVSPDGRCRTFDANARGTIFGNGVGVVLLKRVEDAIADGDSIYAVIRSWGLNNDGGTKVGYTAPSADGQMEAIATAHALADISADTITYIEAHGTGTPLGDPIEIDALVRAFRLTTDAKQFCAIGSAKTNIGHLDCAAGVAGLIKTALSLTHRQIPPSLHFETPNPNIDFENSPFYVNTELSDWNPGSMPRRAGISSFGVGGTNAHVVVEEAPALEINPPQRKSQLVTLSARSEKALDAMTANLVAYLRKNQDLELADVAHTLHVGRKTFGHTRIVVADSAEDAAMILEKNSSQRVYTHHQVRRNIPVVFMFPGQGSQYINMGRDLYESESVFRQHFDRCADILTQILNFDIRPLIYPTAELPLAEQQQINQTSVAQPGIFAVEYAIAQMWMAMGIQPQAFIGHSVGEFVAACLAGIFSLEDALALVAARGRLMQDLPSGSMMAVRTSEQKLLPLLPPDVEIGAINGPLLCVISGPTESVDMLQKKLEEQDIVCRALRTSHAFHSAMMDPVIEPFSAQINEVTLRPPQVPILSTVTTEWLTPEQATDPTYWAAHLRKTVRFSESVGQLLAEQTSILLEVGPGQTLSTLARQHPMQHEKQVILSSSPHVQQQISHVEFILQTLGRLWQAGVDIDWSALYSGEQRKRVHLPTYPFERKRFWYDTGEFAVQDAPNRSRRNMNLPTEFILP